MDAQHDGAGRRRRPSAKAAAAADSASGSDDGSSSAGSSAVIIPPPSKPKAGGRAKGKAGGSRSGSGGSGDVSFASGGGGGGGRGTKRKGGGSSASLREAVARPCMGCVKIKLRCFGGYPCQRCFERCIPCELVASGKKGAAVAAALPSPTERVKMILTVADFGSLSEIYTHGIVRAHESGLVCRRQALRVLRLWRASSQAAGSDVTLGAFAVIAARLGVAAPELESNESLVYDGFKSKAKKGDLMAMAVRGMSLRQTHEFRQADGGNATGIFMWALGDHEAALAVNDTFRSFILGASEVSSSISRQKVLSALSLAFFFAPDDRERFLECLAEIMFAKPPRAITNIFKGVDGTGEVKIVIHTMRSFVLEDGRTAIMHRIERAPASGHINHRPSTRHLSGQYRAVRDFYKSGASVPVAAASASAAAAAGSTTNSSGSNNSSNNSMANPSPTASPQPSQLSGASAPISPASSSSETSPHHNQQPQGIDHTTVPVPSGLVPLASEATAALSGGGNVITPTPPMALAFAAGARFGHALPAAAAAGAMPPPASGGVGGGREAIFSPPSQILAAMGMGGAGQGQQQWQESGGGSGGGGSNAGVGFGAAGQYMGGPAAGVYQPQPHYQQPAAQVMAGAHQYQHHQQQPQHHQPAAQRTLAQQPMLMMPQPAAPPPPPLTVEAPPPLPWVCEGWGAEGGATPQGGAGGGGPPPLPGSPPQLDLELLEGIFSKDEDGGLGDWQ